MSALVTLLEDTGYAVESNDGHPAIRLANVNVQVHVLFADMLRTAREYAPLARECYFDALEEAMRGAKRVRDMIVFTRSEM